MSPLLRRLGRRRPLDIAGCVRELSTRPPELLPRGTSVVVEAAQLQDHDLAQVVVRYVLRREVRELAEHGAHYRRARRTGVGDNNPFRGIAVDAPSAIPMEARVEEAMEVGVPPAI